MVYLWTFRTLRKLSPTSSGRTAHEHSTSERPSSAWWALSEGKARRDAIAATRPGAGWSSAGMLLTGATLVLSTFQTVHAQDTVSFFSSGYGKFTCSAYLTASRGLDPNVLRKMTNDQRVFLSENAMYDQWILGFLSARNFASAQLGNKRPDVKFTNAEAVAWIREWCGTHPGSPVLEGTLEFTRDRWGRADVQYVFLTFQQNVSNEDVTAFLQAYKASIVTSPTTAGGFYKLRLETPIPANELPSLLESMKGQPRIVANVVAN